MKFTEEMIAEDERRWHSRDVYTELGYCGNYMRDRRDMRNDDIRFYAYLMRQAHKMLIENPNETDFVYDEYMIPMCKKCGFHPFSGFIPSLTEMEQKGFNYCPRCGRRAKWYD